MKDVFRAHSRQGTVPRPALGTQNCEAGQTDWSELPAEGQDPHSLKAPAPAVTVTAAAAADGHGAQADTASETTPGTVQAAAVSDDGVQARSWAGLVAGVGGLALARTRGTKTAPVRVPAPNSGPRE